MDSEKLIPIVLFLATVVGWIASYFKSRGMDEAQQRIIDEKLRELNSIDEKQWKEIDKGKEWENRHEKEAWENRNMLDLKIATLHGENQKLSQMLVSIENKLDSLIDRLGK